MAIIGAARKLAGATVDLGINLGKTAMKGFEADGLLRKGFESAWDGTIKAGQSILHSNEPMNAIRGMGKSAMENAGKFAQGAKNTAEEMMKQAGEKVNEAAAKAGIPDLGASIQNAGDELGSKIAGMGEGAYRYAQQVAPETVKAAEDVAAAGKKLGEEVAENISKKADELHLNKKGFEDAADVAKEMAGNAKVKFSGLGKTAKSKFSGFTDDAKENASRVGEDAKGYASNMRDRAAAFGKDIRDNYGLYAKKAITADREDWGTKKFERLGMTVGDTSDEAIRNMSKSQLAKSMFLNNNGTISKSSVAIAGLGAVGAAGLGLKAVTPSFSLDGSGKGKTGALIGASVGYSMGGHASDAFKGAALGYLAGR